MSAVVSVLIPQYGRPELTRRAVDAVLRSRGDVTLRVHVHHNGSEEPSVSRDGPDGVVTTRSRENLGFGPAVNRMARDADGEFLLILNNDTVVHPDAVARLVDRARAADAGPVVPLYRDFLGRPLEMGGGIGEGARAWQLWRNEVVPVGLATTPHRADYGSAAAMLVRRELFLDAGGFDDVFAPAYYEDVDLCMRLAEQGRPTIVEPRAVVFHYEGGTAGTDLSSGLKTYQVRNRSTMAERWGGQLAARGPVGLHRSIMAATEPSSGQPRVLWVGTVLPRGDRDGGGRRTMEMLAALRDQGVGIAFYARSVHDPDRYGPRLADLGIPWFGGSGPARWAGGARPTSRYDDLRELLTAAPWDVVVVFSARLGRRVADEIRAAAPQAALVIDNGDLHFLRHDRGRELGIEITDTLTKDHELDAYVASDGVITSSEPEDDVLHGEVEGLATHVFTVAPPEPVPLPSAPDGALMFLGNFGHPPNTDAVEHWVAELAPRVSESLGRGVPLRVVGAATDALPSDPSLDVVGWVPELADEFLRTRLFLAPLRYGAGTKGKLVEAMAHGVPVVTTPVGAEGFPGRVVDALVVAEDPDEIARHVVVLLTDDEAWRRQREQVIDAARWFHDSYANAGGPLAAWLMGRAYAHRRGGTRARRVAHEPERDTGKVVGGTATERQDRAFDPAVLGPELRVVTDPVFVLGAPRSGTSMMAHALGQHPELWTGEESDFLAPLGRSAREAWEFGRTRGELHWLSGEGVSWEEFAAYLGLGMNALYTERSQGLRWVEQTPQYTLSLPLVVQMFPGARFVYMLRDGRSVVHSLRHFVRPLEHEAASRLWARFVRAGLDFAGSPQGERLRLVRYERVVTETAVEMGRLFDFLGLEPAAESVEFIAERGPINSSFRGETSTAKAAPRWAGWTRAEREYFHEVAGDVLVELGFETDASWVTADVR